MAASELKPNISNVNLNKSKKKLFLYFDNSHANQTNTTTKIRFFLYIVNINENLKKIMRRNIVLSVYNRATYLDQTQHPFHNNVNPITKK